MVTRVAAPLLLLPCAALLRPNRYTKNHTYGTHTFRGVWTYTYSHDAFTAAWVGHIPVTSQSSHAHRPPVANFSQMGRSATHTPHSVLVF